MFKIGLNFNARKMPITVAHTSRAVMKLAQHFAHQPDLRQYL